MKEYYDVQGYLWSIPMISKHTGLDEDFILAKINKGVPLKEIVCGMKWGEPSANVLGYKIPLKLAHYFIWKWGGTTATLKNFRGQVRRAAKRNDTTVDYIVTERMNAAANITEEDFKERMTTMFDAYLRNPQAYEKFAYNKTADCNRELVVHPDVWLRRVGTHVNLMSQTVDMLNTKVVLLQKELDNAIMKLASVTDARDDALNQLRDIMKSIEDKE